MSSDHIEAYPFLIFTRFGLTMTDPEMYESRFSIFEHIAVQTMKKQRDQRFHWILFVDEQIPESSLDKTRSILSQKNFHIVPVDLTDLNCMTQGTIDWLHYAGLDYAYSKGLISHPGQYVLTAIRDDDDPWHINTVGLARREADHFLRDKAKATDPDTTVIPGNSYLQAHSDGLVFSFSGGARWWIHLNSITRFNGPETASMSVFVCTRASSNVSALSCRHSEWRAFSRILGYQFKLIEGEKPMWLHVRHSGNLSGVTQHNEQTEPALPYTHYIASFLQENFSIDLDLVRSASPIPDSEYACDHHELLGLQYTISAHNRQINALDHGIAMTTGDERCRLEQLLNESKARREIALRRYYNLVYRKSV